MCIRDRSSVESDIHDDKPKKKSKQLRISVCDFQSIWDKHALLKHHLLENNIDILIGSESHLSPNISNSEFLPDDYTAVRDDRKDGYGGVIIVYKKNTWWLKRLPQITMMVILLQSR